MKAMKRSLGLITNHRIVNRIMYAWIFGFRSYFIANSNWDFTKIRFFSTFWNKKEKKKHEGLKLLRNYFNRQMFGHLV